MNLGGDGELFARPARFVLRLGKQGVLQQRSCFRRNGIEQLLIHFAQFSRTDLAIEIEQPQQLCVLIFLVALAQRNAIDAANLVHHHAGPGRCAARVRQSVTDGELCIALNGLLDGPVRDRRVLFNKLAFRVQPPRKLHFAALAEEDEAALHAGQL